MFYSRGKNFDVELAESRRKHVPLFFELDMWADTPSMYYEAGPMKLYLSAGDLNKCRKVDMDPALTRKMGVGKIYRMSSTNDVRGEKARIIFKLWWQPNSGYVTTRHDRNEFRTEHVFDVPEDLFLRWIVDDADNILAVGCSSAEDM